MRIRLGAVSSLVAVVLLGAACYPPSQNPTDQPIPPGGRVVATGPVLTEMWIEDATADLSAILYRRNDFMIPVGDPIPHRFWLYDDVTATTTEVPVGRAEYGSAGVSPDGRFVVFASNDRPMQVGPASSNCFYGHPNGPWYPPIPAMCDELYLFDVLTGERQQLTGLEGSSEVDHVLPSFTEDGQSIEYQARNRDVPTTYHRMDLSTGTVEEIPAPVRPTSWDRGSHVVDWDATTGTLTSRDTTTGEVTTLWSHDAAYYLQAVTGDGRFIVVSYWQTERLQVFRLIDTDTGDVMSVPTPWISFDGDKFAVVQVNVAPDATDRLVIAPLLR